VVCGRDDHPLDSQDPPPLTIREVTRAMPATTMSGASSISPAPLVRLASDARP